MRRSALTPPQRRLLDRAVSSPTRSARLDDYNDRRVARRLVHYVLGAIVTKNDGEHFQPNTEGAALGQPFPERPKGQA